MERERLAGSQRDRDRALGVEMPDVVWRPGHEPRPAARLAAPALEPGVERIGGEAPLERRLGDRDAACPKLKRGIGDQQRDEQRERELRILDEDRAGSRDHVLGQTCARLAAVLAPARAKRRQSAAAVALDPAIERGTRYPPRRPSGPADRDRADAGDDLAADIVCHRPQRFDDLVVAPLRDRPKVGRA
jgi:hypothetical protein